MPDQTDATDQQAGQNATEPTPAGAQNTEPGPVPYARFREVNEELKQLKAWRADWEKAEAKRKADAEAAEAERLKKQGEFEKLAEQAQAKARELEQQVATASERVKTLETALKTYLDQERQGLPAHILALLDALPVEKQLEYIATNRQALKPAPAQQSGGGIPPTPAPGSPPGKLSEEERRKRAWQPKF